MDSKLTVEQMQIIIGKLTINYELQLTAMVNEINRLAALVPKVAEVPKKQ